MTSIRITAKRKRMAGGQRISVGYGVPSPADLLNPIPKLGVFMFGPDADKPADPAVGSAYLATDIEVLFVCFTAGVWLPSAEELEYYVYIKAIAATDDLVTGNGQAYITIPSFLNAMVLFDADAAVYTPATVPSDWVASTVYSLNDRVKPTTPNGHYYKCTSAGTSDSSEPTWPTTSGSTVVDNTATWTEDNPAIQIHNVTDAVDMLSTKITIEEDEYNSWDAATAPVINTSNDDVVTGDRIRVDVDIAGAGAKGLDVILGFRRE